MLKNVIIILISFIIFDLILLKVCFINSDLLQPLTCFIKEEKITPYLGITLKISLPVNFFLSPDQAIKDICFLSQNILIYLNNNSINAYILNIQLMGHTSMNTFSLTGREIDLLSKYINPIHLFETNPIKFNSYLSNEIILQINRILNSYEINITPTTIRIWVVPIN